MLQTILIGNLGADAVLKEINGKKFISFRVAHSERKQDKVTWVSVLRYAENNQAILPYLTKGTQVFVSGEISARAYQNHAGEIVPDLSIMAEKIQLLGGRNGNTQNDSAQLAQQPAIFAQNDIPQTQPKAKQPNLDDAGLPF